VKQGKRNDLSQLSMLELFRIEAENQTGILTSGLLELERGQGAPEQLETLMRAAHSLKGAARIINFELAVHVAHAMEDCFVAAQRGTLRIGKAAIDVLLSGVDLLLNASKETEPGACETEHAEAARLVTEQLRDLLAGRTPADRPPTSTQPPPAETLENLPLTEEPQRTNKAAQADVFPVAVAGREESSTPALRPPETPERVVRLTAENLNRLLGLAGESLVESRWLRPFAESLQRLKRHHGDISQQIDQLRRVAGSENLSEQAANHLQELGGRMMDCQQYLAARIEELDVFDRRTAHLSHRLYLEVLRTRMRPFADGIGRFPRMVRDVAHSLGKEVRLEISGENTQVDRDILERLEAPLAHLLRNAVDHGCEMPEQRVRAGKAPEGLIRLEARHSAGMLLVTITDDGTGVDPEQIRRVIVQKKLTQPVLAEKLSEAELLEFLFLPGFTMKETVTEISGRGVGLDVVLNMVKSVRGSIRLNTQPGRGLRVQVQLPLTLSVLRTLLVEAGGEPYAIPLTQISRTLKLGRDQIEMLEGRRHFRFDNQQIGLLTAHAVLDCGEPRLAEQELCVVVVGDRNTRYGLVVDRFLGERELVVQPLDPRLGKVKDVSAAALMEDGSPVLIIDGDDLLRSIEKLISGGLIGRGQSDGLELAPRKHKRVLAVDDSLTVRELERKLLTNRGFLTDVAVDGMDAWNAVRTGHYDLVVTDVDMPRMDGVELARLIKKDSRLKSMPVMIVSYKDNEEDRLRGLDAGADYYLTKGSFHDETLLEAVVDLIGEPEA
jgi:two-component system sensor histidine kinase and response regulator WspE